MRPEVLAEVDRADEARAREAASQAARGALEYDVRALGDAVRAFGRAEAEENGGELEQAHRRALDSARRAIERAPDAVLALRAYQTRAFVREMHAFEETGTTSAELVELGGASTRSAEAYGWYDRAERRLAPDDAALAAMFKKRWNELTNLKGPVFALTLDEERALYRFLLQHPAIAFAPLGAAAGSDAARAQAVARRIATEQKRLEKIRDLARIDPEYPAWFAQGVVLFRLGRYEAAAVAFERHLDAHPDGPWTLRARNHLKAALEAR